MSDVSRYYPLIKQLGELEAAQQAVTDADNWHQRATLKQSLGDQEKAWAKTARPLVRELADAHSNAALLQAQIARDAAELKTRLDESWFDTIDECKRRLQTLAKSESGKSALRRRAERHGPWLGIMALVVCVVGLKWLWLVDVNAPISTAKGVMQRGEALDKVLFYDAGMTQGTRRSSGWGKRIFMWPAEPTAAEINAASELLGLGIQTYQSLQRRQAVCGEPLRFSTQPDARLDEVRLAEGLVHGLEASAKTPTGNGRALLSAAIQSAFPCA